MSFKFNLFLFGMLSCLLISCDKADDSIIIVQDGYVGQVLIVFNQKSGLREEYQEDKRVYHIQQNGMLKSRFDSNDGIAKVPEFYYGEIQKENRIGFVGDASILPSDKIVAHGGVAGSYKGVKFIQYFIGNREKIFDIYETPINLENIID